MAANLSDRQLLTALLRQNLHAFTVRTFQTVNPGTKFRPNWHVDAVVHHLRGCLSGDTRRLIITQPPRTLKSLCVSVAFVAWALGYDPSRKFIVVSYSNELAASLARMFRAVVTSAWYHRAFPQVQAAKDTDLEFVTTLGGGRFATSVGGTLTGRGADIIIMDDPLKAEEGMSKTARDRLIEWYRNTLVSRLNDKQRGVLILVMQRLHEEDLAGYLLERGGWAHLDLPAIALERQVVPIGPGEHHVREPDDVLHPGHEPRDVLDQIKAEIGSQNFSAQYQQRPVPADGNMIKWKWFQVYAYAPAHDADGRIVQSWDTALKAGDTNDYSVCTTWLTKGTNYYLLDVYRDRLEFPALKAKVQAMAHQFAAHSVLIEDTGSGTALIQQLNWEHSRARPIAIKPERDKATRMWTACPTIEAGQVLLPEEAPWLDDFKNEILAFPHGRFDDQVDSLSQFLTWAEFHRHNRISSGLAYGLIW